jgi:P27 family predicted phage terminase small subunit
MNRAEWRQRIEDACVGVGTYKPAFDSIIESLAIIMEMRDTAQAEFEADGCKATMEYTNKGGATNVVKNPALQVVDELHKTALSYWKELGLTPSGLKKLKEAAAVAEKEMTALDKALAKLGEKN